MAVTWKLPRVLALRSMIRSTTMLLHQASTGTAQLAVQAYNSLEGNMLQAQSKDVFTRCITSQWPGICTAYRA
jgi:hypothetical protein